MRLAAAGGGGVTEAPESKKGNHSARHSPRKIDGAALAEDRTWMGRRLGPYPPLFYSIACSMFDSLFIV